MLRSSLGQCIPSTMASGFFAWPLLLMFRSWQPGQLGQPAQRFGVRAHHKVSSMPTYKIQYNTIRCNTNTIQYNTINSIRYNAMPIQYNTIQYNTIQYNTNTRQYNTIQYNAIQYNTNTIQYNMIQYNTNTRQHNTIQYNTIQYNTIQYNTIQYNSIQIPIALQDTLRERQQHAMRLYSISHLQAGLTGASDNTTKKY